MARSSSTYQASDSQLPHHTSRPHQPSHDQSCSLLQTRSLRFVLVSKNEYQNFANRQLCIHSPTTTTQRRDNAGAFGRGWSNYSPTDSCCRDMYQDLTVSRVVYRCINRLEIMVGSDLQCRIGMCSSYNAGSGFMIHHDVVFVYRASIHRR